MPQPRVSILTTPSPPTPTSTTPNPEIREGNGGRLFLLSPVESPSSGNFDDKSFQKGLNSPSLPESDSHDFRPPGPTDSRCPCPALNTLANHGYLPRDGKNITISTLMSALENSETYNLSTALAIVLAGGGESLIGEPILSILSAPFKDDIPLSLHDLALRRSGPRGIEHNASVVHKNSAKDGKYGPTHTDPDLLNDFLQGRSDVDLAHIARRRVALERISHLDAVHAEIARGEWALVLGIFGHAYGGKIPVDELRVWLGENRFPKDWHPSHEQTLPETTKTASELREAMKDFGESQPNGLTTDEERLKRMLIAEPDEVTTPQ